MSFFRSFRFKIFISFWIFGILLVVLYHVTGYFILQSEPVKKEIYRAELFKELVFLKEQYERYGIIKELNSRFVTTYPTADALPLPLHAIVKDLDIGYHYLTIPAKDNSIAHYYIQVQKHFTTNEPVYFLFDHDRYEKEYKLRVRLRSFGRFRLAFTFVVVLGFFIGLIISHTLIAPLKKLSALVSDTEPENLPVDFSKSFKNNEVGVLAQAIEKTMRRIEGFIKREQYFTRDASHELRTPVTVIKGAVELIRQHSTNTSDAFDRILQRIERSLKSMEVTIETFLWLGREDEIDKNSSGQVMNAVVKDVIEDNQYLLYRKPVDVQYNETGELKIRAPEPVFKIAVTNLIRNAFSYIDQGDVMVIVSETSVEIIDTGKGIPRHKLSNITKSYEKGDDSKGFGLGLAIVERLCRKLHWQLEVASTPGQGTKARLVIPQQDSDKVSWQSDKVTEWQSYKVKKP